MRPEAVLGRKQKRRGVARRRLAGRALMLLLVLALAGTALYFISRFPEDVEKFSYPVLYRELIDKYAEQYQLDSAHVAAVIYCESSYQPGAVSPVGARGLMQIMPDTGGWIAEKLKEKDTFTTDMLFDPELSIRYGCWYLNYLSGRFGGDLRKITAAYHAGGGKVDAWLKDENYSADGVTLAAMPAGATNTYVRNIEKVYEKYKELYADDAK